MEELVINEKTKNKTPIVPVNDFTELSGSWHSTWTYNITYQIKNSTSSFTSQITLQVCGVITGCGLVQMHGISNISEHNFDLVKEKLETIKNDLRNDGAGCIMCTLGQSYYNREELLLSLGFIMVSEYANYRHGQDGKYKQRMYLLTY